MLRASILLATLFLSSCIGPDYQKPSIILSGSYKEAPKGWKLAQPCEGCAKQAWWQIFKDPALDDLIAQVNVNNENIAAAAAQYKQALALIDETKAAYWPVISLNPSIAREKSATATVGSKTTNASPSTTYILEPSASWSPDIFGVVRLAVDASRAGAQASAAQLAATKLSTQALLAQTYFQLRALDLTQQLLDDTVLSYTKALELTKNQYAVGVAARLDIIQADTQLQSAVAQALDNKIARAQYEHAIAVLIGKAPANFAIGSKYGIVAIPTIPLELPSALLERRPDVAQAERLMAQANANIGVAVAAYFPVLSLTGAEGFSANRFKQLFTQPSRIWSLGAAVAETIFNGGLRGAKVSAAEAAYDQNVASYKQTVLTALQQVEDNLAALRILEAENVVQDIAVADAQLALKITLNQYKAGTVSYVNVIAAQTTAYAAQKTAAGIYSRRMVAAVSLIQALGGDWHGGQL
jgi:NodT family efflux transporter outer membrane factor (OMF) lipoprotein